MIPKRSLGAQMLSNIEDLSSRSMGGVGAWKKSHEQSGGFRPGRSLPEKSCDSFAAVALVDSTGSPPSAGAAVCFCSRCRSGSFCERGSSASDACGSCRRRPRSSSRCTYRNARTRSRCRTGRTYRRSIGASRVSGLAVGSETR